MLSQDQTMPPTSIKKAISMTIVPSLASRTNLVPAPQNLKEAKDKKSGKNVSVFGKGLPNGDDALVKKSISKIKLKGRTPSLVFDGAASTSSPTDPDAAVGKEHYVLVFNTGFRIFDKLGNPLTAQLDTSNIFPNSGCCDLTCSYDTQAERFVMTFLGNGVQVAVSQTSDPVNGGWFVYNYPMNTDYQKLSIWSDGYYFTANKNSGSAGTSEVVYAIERTKMLLGDPNAQIIGFPLPGIATSGFYSPQAFNVTSTNYPAPGNVPIVYMQDDAWSGVTQDHIKLWKVNVDWVTAANSTISTGETIVTTPFTSVFDGGSFVNLEQPNGGSDIDALQATIMNQAQFRKFATHNSAIFNFVIDVDGTASGKLAAIRWYEMRQSADGQPWSIYQEGTYTSPNGKHAWHASMGMDSLGNIGMGYSSMGKISNETLSSYYTGRYANDPLGTMSIEETLIAAGNQNIPGTRYGDYSKVALDPSDDKSFWFVNEYMNSGRKDVVGVFKIAPNLNSDVGVVAITSPNTGTLTNTETVTVTIFNYGINSASNFPVSFQIDGGAIITENFSDLLASSATAQFTFTATASLSTVGQTYVVRAFTALVGDEDLTNNATLKNVIHLTPNDIGVSAITSPISGTGLTATENIIVELTNFGGQPQTNFNVSYTLDGNSTTQLYTNILAPNSTVNFTFTQTGDLSALGPHTLSATTNLSTDTNSLNNTTSVTITKSNCTPVHDCNLGDGFRLISFGTINNPSTCGTNGYNDFTNLSTNLEQSSSTSITIATAYGNQYVTAWIDFNNDFVYSTSEKVLNNYVIGLGQGQGNYSQTTTFAVPAAAALGEHLMRFNSNWNAPVPEDACADTTYGETEDYTVNITGNLSISDVASKNSNLVVTYQKNNQFEIILENSQSTDPLFFSVHNIYGQKIVQDKIVNRNGKYTYTLDMSYASAGVYLVRLGNNQSGKVKRIIVN